MGAYNKNNSDIHFNRNIDLENEIESRIGNNKIPRLMAETFNFNPNATIYFRKPTEQRQGSAEHIILDHKHQIDENFLNVFSKTLKNPENIDEIGFNKKGQKRYELSTYFGESSRSKNRHLYFIILIDYIDSQTFEIVTAYPKPRKQKRD